MNNSDNPIQVYILSQQSLFRQGLERCITTDGIDISGNTIIDDEALSAMDKLPPDVILVDIDSGTDNALSLTRKIKQLLPHIGIIVLSSSPSDAQLFQALKAQAAAYLTKEITSEELIRIIRSVARGEHPINESLMTRPNLANQVLHQFQELSLQNETKAFISPLTARETEILNYIAEGYLNKQIAVKLGISEQTIKNHVTSILRKLNANVRTEAVVVAIKQGLISVKRD
ncbi:LuxR C-terminal-related transcriptional regulator [Chloroflexota bacterium]